MNEKKYNEELLSFINKATCPFTGVKEIKRILLENDFQELEENKLWILEETGKYFVTRNDASIIGFTLGNNESFNIICTHIDTPAFTIKPKNDIYEKKDRKSVV